MDLQASPGTGAVSRFPTRTVRIIAGAVAVLCAAFLLCASAQAAEEETHVFDAKRSLTGDCSVSATIDPVPDPGCPGGEHPPEPFAKHGAVAVDLYGNRYVLSAGPADEGSPEFASGGRVDIFNSEGEFIEEIAPVGIGAFRMSIAVDSQGYLYVARGGSSGEVENTERLLRYKPTQYNPAAGEIEYDSPPSPVPGPNLGGWGAQFLALEIDPANDHLFVKSEGDIYELGSAGEGNSILDSIVGFELGLKGGIFSDSFAIDSARGRLYVTDLVKAGNAQAVVKAFNLEAPHDPLFTIDGSTTPTKRFVSESRVLPVAVDETTGHIFVGDLEASPTRRVYEFDPEGNPVSTFGEGRLRSAVVGQQTMAYDDSPLSPRQGTLYVPSDSGPSRSLAFKPIPEPALPVVEDLSVTDIDTSGAILHGSIIPNILATDYRVEFITEQAFQENGESFAGANLAGEGTVEGSDEPVAVRAEASGLQPGTAYRFRIVAENELGEADADARFATFSAVEASAGCPNQDLRTGASALLPDCRAYELVSPADSNGREPLPVGKLGGRFVNRQVSPAGDRLPFRIEGGPPPGLEGAAGLNGDPYLSTRTAGGWVTAYTGPSPAFAPSVIPGNSSPDQGYSIWFATGNQGPALLNGLRQTSYLRYPDGHSLPLGTGSLGIDPLANPLLISEGGGHILFSTGNISEGVPSVQLEPEAAPGGNKAIYDRTGDGTLHVVSLKPGNAPMGRVDSFYEGASSNGISVAFRMGEMLYLRYDNAETYVPAPEALSGSPVECSAGNSLAGASPEYTWLLNGSPVPGATESTYIPDSGEAGSELQCQVRAINGEGGGIDVGPPLLVDQPHPGGQIPRPAQDPTVPATATVGEEIECLPGPWSAEPVLSFQWYRGADPISGATSSTYEVQAEDDGKELRCGVTGEANGVAVLSISDAVKVNIPIPAPPVAPANGVTVVNVIHPGVAPVVGDQIRCQADDEPDKWENSPTFTYQWLRNGALAGTSRSYTVAAADAGTSLQCRVRASNADGTVHALTPPLAIAPTVASELPSGSLSLQGAPAVGATLECVPDAWQNGPALSYRWLRNGTATGVTTSTYNLTAADRNTVVQCELTATNSVGAVLQLAGTLVGLRPAPQVSTPLIPAKSSGITDDGDRFFFLQAGDLKAFDPATETLTSYTDSGDVTPVTIAADGTSAYFVSPSVLTPQANPHGDEAQPGEQNLYLSREGEISFVATVTERDVKGGFDGNTRFDGLGLWTAEWAFAPAAVPARTSFDGGVLLFSSRAQLTDFDSDGHAELYRYASDGDLQCISCGPMGTVPSSDATLQSRTKEGLLLFLDNNWLENLRPDGRRAFFESRERLVATDGDGRLDVYQWEDQGVGTCEKAAGCVRLISTGQSGRDEHLFAVSRSGDDVFFLSAGLLTPEDKDETFSVYDARVDGGFPPPPVPAGECLGEACQPAVVAPNDPTPASSVFEGAGNVAPDSASVKPPCPKGKRAVRRGGKVRCVPRKGKSRHHKKRANKNRRAGR